MPKSWPGAAEAVKQARIVLEYTTPGCVVCWIRCCSGWQAGIKYAWYLASADTLHESTALGALHGSTAWEYITAALHRSAARGEHCNPSLLQKNVGHCLGKFN